MNLSLSDAGRIQGKSSMAFPQLRRDGEKTNKNGKGNTASYVGSDSSQG